MPAQKQWYVALRGATVLPIYRIFTVVVHARMVVRDTSGCKSRQRTCVHALDSRWRGWLRDCDCLEFVVVAFVERCA